MSSFVKRIGLELYDSTYHRCVWLPQKRIQYQLNILCCKISNLNEIMQARFFYNILASDAALAWTFVERAESGGIRPSRCSRRLWWNVRALVICLSAIAREWKRRCQLRKTTNKDLLLTTGVRIGRWRMFRAKEGERHGENEEETIGRSL